MNVPSETPVTTSQADPLRSSSIRKLSAFEVGFSRISGRSCGRSELSIPEWAGRMWVRTTVSALKERKSSSSSVRSGKRMVRRVERCCWR